MRAMSFTAQPINPVMIYGMTQPHVFHGVRNGMRGLQGCPGGGHVSCTGNGCGCSGGSGLNGLGQALSPSLDSVIQGAFAWLGGSVQANLPASAAVSPNIGSAGAALTTLMGYLPYIVGGYLLYKVVSK